MEFFAILIGLVIAAGVTVAPIVSLVFAWQARRRIAAVEQQNDELWAEIRKLGRAHEEAKKRAEKSAAELVKLRAEIALRTVPVEVPVEPSAASASELAATAPPLAEIVAEPVTTTPAPMTSPAPASTPAPTPTPAPLAPPAPRPAGPVRRAPEPIPLERFAIWVLAGAGGLGVVVASLFFYDLAVERGLITPAIRYALGLAAGTGMILGAEVLWRRDYRIPAAAVQGAGLGVLYAALYAGYSRYELVPNLLTFALMAGATAASAIFANRHRSLFLALLGGIGGYMTPVMLSTGENKAVALFTYVALLNVGLLWVASRRRWPVLVGFAGVAALAMQIGWGLSFRTADQLPIALGAAVVLGGLFVARSLLEEDEGLEWVRRVAGVSALGLLWGPLPFLVPPDGLGDGLADVARVAATAGAGWLLVSHLVTQGVASRLRSPWLSYLGAAAGALPLFLFTVSWADHDPPAMIAATVALVGVAGIHVFVAGQGERPLLGAAALALSCLFWMVMWEVAPSPSRIPSGVGVAVVGLVALAALSLVSPLVRGASWAPLLGLVTAALGLWGVLGDPLLDAGQPGSLLGISAAFYAVYAVYPFVVRAWGPGTEQPAPAGPWIASALAGPALFFPMMQGWTAALGDGAIGALPVLLAAGSVVAVTALVRTWRATSSDRNLALFAGVGLLFAAGAVPLQLSNEWLTIGWAVEAAALAWLTTRLHHPLIRPTSLVLAGLVVVRLLFNPDALDYHAAQGVVIFNWILYTWGIPALACLYMARRYKDGPAWISPSLLVVSILLFFALVNLEVSHAFAGGGELQVTSRDFEEGMVRSLCWAAFGIVLLVVGIWSRGKLLRVLSLGFLMLAAAKVGFVDLWSLGGMARVGSLLGLGLLLLVGALLFRRFEKDITSKSEDEEPT